MPLLPPQNPYAPGYALPDNVEKEPYGQGVYVTKYMPRKSIATLTQDWASEGIEKGGPNMLGSLGGVPGGILGGKHALSSKGGYGVLGSVEGIFGNRRTQTTLGAHAAGGPGQVGGPGDVIADFGRKGAKGLLETVKSAPPADRKAALKLILDSMDRGFWSKVEAKADELKGGKGYDAATALEKALAITLANRMTAQLVDLGKSGKMPLNGPLGLASSDGMNCCCQNLSGALGLGFGLSSITGAVKSAAKAVGSGVKTAVKATGSGVATAAKATGSGVASASGAVFNTAKKGLGLLGSLACSTVGQVGIAGAATVAGGPAGGAGAAVAGALCAGSGGGGGAFVPQEPAPAAGIPLVPILIGGGVLAFFLLRK